MGRSIRPEPFVHLANQAEQTIRARAKTLVAEIALARTAGHLTLRLSRRTVRIGWLLVLFFHLFNTGYASALAYLYHYMAKPEMEYYVELLQMMPQQNYQYIVSLYAFIGAMNCYSAVQMVFYSLYYQHLAFGKVKRRRAALDKTSIQPTKRSWMIWRSTLCPGVMKGLYRAISVRGGWFDDVLLLREVAEIASQTVQAHSSSLLINSVWVNQIFASLICLNAVANMLVHMMLKKEVGWRRFVCTAVDLALDFTWGFILPGKIIYQYFVLFVRNNYSLPYEFSYSDTEMIKAMLECDQFFMSSWLDAVTTTLPYLNMLSGLRNIKLLLQHDMDALMGATRIQPIFPAAGLPDTDNNRYRRHAISSMALNGGDRDESMPELSMRHQWSLRAYLVKFVYVSMPLLGLFVLFTSITASRFWLDETSACVPGCRLRMHPWFATQCACSVLEINCYEYGIDGSAEEITTILKSLDRRTLNSLIVTHCPALAITPAIRLFSNLLQLELYNSTVVDWDSSASLSLPYHPRLGAVFIVRSRFQRGIPDGLTSDLAPGIIDLEFIATDLGGALADDLDEKWSAVSMLFIEHCSLQEFPSFVGRMALTDLSLVGNNISRFPSSLPPNLPWLYVYFDSNPLLDQLPDNLSVTDDLQYVTLQNSGLATIPPWLSDRMENRITKVFAHGTPFCNAFETAGPNDTRLLAHCSDSEAIFSTEGVFPLAMRDQQRQLHWL